MTSEETLKTYQQKQLNLIKNIERIKVLVDESASAEKLLSAAELRCRLDILETYFKQAISNQSNSEQFAQDYDGWARLQDLYVATKLTVSLSIVSSPSASSRIYNCIYDNEFKISRT